MIQVVDSVREDNLASKQTITQKYKTVFEGLGKFPGKPYKFLLQENVDPSVHAPKKIPKALMPQFEIAIKNFEKAKIIEKVNEPTG